MLNEMEIKDIERQLTNMADVYYNACNNESKERGRGYCQGMAFVLAKIGYAVEWDNGKAIVVKDD